MSQENLELVTRALAAATRRPEPDFETANKLFAKDHVWVPVEAQKLGEGDVVGRRGYRAWDEENRDFMSFETTVRGIVDVSPNQVLVVTTTRFTGTSSGITTEERVWAVVTVTNGQITRTEAYFDPAEALEAVGLSE